MLHKTFNNVSKKLITTAAFDELDRALMWAVAALFALSITLASDVHANSYPQRSTSGVGVDGTPPRSFWYVEVFWNDFTFSGKLLIVKTRWGIFYGWWRCWRSVTSPTMVAILAAILDFPKIFRATSAEKRPAVNAFQWRHYYPKTG